jgi:hypothetical protein
MTEPEWLTSTDPTPMLEFLRGKATNRKLRLFAVACCQSFLGKVRVSPRAKQAIEVAERYADGRASVAELNSAGCFYANSAAEHACMNATELEDGIIMADCAAGNAAWAITKQESFALNNNGLSAIFNTRLVREQASQCNILREIFGNTFRPLSLNPAWLTSTVLALAQGIYEERAFDRMPILADALQDAGCDNDEILTHLRGPGLHAKGCWALDLVLRFS